MRQGCCVLMHAASISLVAWLPFLLRKKLKYSFIYVCAFAHDPDALRQGWEGRRSRCGAMEAAAGTLDSPTRNGAQRNGGGRP